MRFCLQPFLISTIPALLVFGTVSSQIKEPPKYKTIHLSDSNKVITFEEVLGLPVNPRISLDQFEFVIRTKGGALIRGGYTLPPVKDDNFWLFRQRFIFSVGDTILIENLSIKKDDRILKNVKCNNLAIAP